MRSTHPFAQRKRPPLGRHAPAALIALLVLLSLGGLIAVKEHIGFATNSFNGTAGTITQLNLQMRFTSYWAGITGRALWSPGSGNLVFSYHLNRSEINNADALDFECFNFLGERDLYASMDPDPDWATLRAANISEIQTYLGNMDEGSGTVAYDTSDNNNIGILSGPSWGGSTTTCKIGGCLTFDGTNDYVDAGGNSSFDLQNALTIEAWIYPYSVAVTGSIAGNIDAAGDKAQYLFRTTNTGYLNFYQSDTNSLTMTGTSQPITVNAWQHIVVVRTSTTGTITLYRNGIADANIGNSTVLQIPQDNERGNTTIGRFGSASGQYFNGLIDEVRVYNRALSAEEIRYHYNRGGPVP